MSVEVTFRTVSGGSFNLSVEPTNTILEVKKKIADHQNLADCDPSTYRLIFKGKILEDKATVTASGIAESLSSFVVVMPPRKLRPTSKGVTPSKKESKPATAEEKETCEVKTPMKTSASKKDSVEAAVPMDTGAAAAASTATTASPTDSNSLVTGQQYEHSVRQICEMGFPEDEAKRALRAAYNNPNRAVEFLFSGIPEEVVPETPAPAASAPPAAQQTSPANPSIETRNIQPSAPFNMFELPQGEMPRRTGTDANSLDFLRAVPQFNLMRRLIQTNPAVLPQIMERLENINPQLMSIIDANREEFMRLINEPVTETEEMNADVMSQFAQALAGGGSSGPNQPQGNEVYVTEEEHQQIDRLTELASNLGIHRAQVLETWLVCNRDEALTANFLVDHAEELVADQTSGDGRTNTDRNEES